MMTPCSVLMRLCKPQTRKNVETQISRQNPMGIFFFAKQNLLYSNFHTVKQDILFKSYTFNDCVTLERIRKVLA